MKTLKKILLFSPLLLTTSLFADTDASYPPNLHETVGKTSPMFSSASSEASHWLALMDQHQYGAAWLDSGPLFQDLITQDQWIAAMQALRRPLGQVRTRQVTTHQATQTLPGGTQGYFMIIRYNTSFSGKSSMIEILKLMMISHEQWRVISYTFK